MEILTLEALRDNYIYILIDTFHKTAVVVDPSESAPVLEALHKRNLSLTAILNTHHHHDHVGGNNILLEMFPSAKVFGGKNEGRIPSQHVFLAENDCFTVCESQCRILDIPGHTRGHIAYYFEKEGWLFSGDTIFGGTCGAIFEGTPEQMFESLKKIAQLPPNTSIWCSHEYTEMFMPEAAKLDAHNSKILERTHRVKQLRNTGTPTVPLLLQEELDTNPFLRFSNPEFASQYNSNPGLDTFLKVIQASG